MRPSGPGQSFHLLLDLTDILNKFNVRYMVIGAFAVSYHGLPRYTEDADVVIRLSDSGITGSGLTNQFRAAGYHADLKLGDLDDPITGAILAEDEHKNRVDLLLGVRGMDPEALDRSLSTSILDSPVRIIAAEDLIPMKLHAGGFQDIADARGILQVSGDRLNRELLLKLAQRYGATVTRRLDELLKEPQ